MSSVRNAVIVLGTIGAALAGILRKAYKMGEKKLVEQKEKEKKGHGKR